METVDSINRKAILYNIITKLEKERFDFSLEFSSFLVATGELFYRNPDLAKTHEGDGTEETNFYGFMVIMSRYLAAKRVLERKTAGLPEWELRSTSQEMNQEEISKEQDLLMDDDNISELRDISRLVYGMLRYKTGRDRVIPLLKELGKDFAVK